MEVSCWVVEGRYLSGSTAGVSRSENFEFLELFCFHFLDIFAGWVLRPSFPIGDFLGEVRAEFELILSFDMSRIK